MTTTITKQQTTTSMMTTIRLTTVASTTSTTATSQPTPFPTPAPSPAPTPRPTPLATLATLPPPLVTPPFSLTPSETFEVTSGLPTSAPRPTTPPGSTPAPTPTPTPAPTPAPTPMPLSTTTMLTEAPTTTGVAPTSSAASSTSLQATTSTATTSTATTIAVVSNRGTSDNMTQTNNIIIGVVVSLIVLFAIGLVVFLLRRTKRRKDIATNATDEMYSPPPSALAKFTDNNIAGTKLNSITDENGYSPPPSVLAARSNDDNGNTSSNTNSDKVDSMPSERKRDVFAIKPEELVRKAKIGSGAFGVVYRGLWRSVPVAIKEVSNADALSALKSEAEHMRNLHPHRNVVEFYGVCVDGESVSLVTAFCERGGLSNLLYGEQRMTFSKQQLASIAVDAALGVRHLHAENFIHRDIAARNVFIDDDFTAKVGDFGMSKFDESNEADKSQITFTKVGPLKWMSPEQLNHQKYSLKSDVYSFGVLLFEIFKQSPPWVKYSAVQAAARVMRGKTMRFGGAVGNVAHTCWRFESRDRPTMVEVHLALVAALQKTTDIGDESGQSSSSVQSSLSSDASSE